MRVTLAVRGRGKLRPGMFADVFVETDRRSAVLVIPKAALTLDSIGDTVFVAAAGKAQRREIELGFSEGDSVQVVAGLSEDDEVVVVGQDGLSDGTPIQVLSGPGGAPAQVAAAGDAAGGAPFAGGRMDPSQMTPEMLERMKQRMRDRGLTEEQIEEQLARFRQRQDGGGEQ